jgi:beta-galactosidase
VPGLIHLAEPKIVEYDKLFKRPDRAEAKEQYNLYNLDYTPRYSWYRKKVFIPGELENKEGMITFKKSQYVTMVYINGIDLGTSMACYTPVEFPVNKTIKFGSDNVFLRKSKQPNYSGSPFLHNIDYFGNVRSLVNAI